MSRTRGFPMPMPSVASATLHRVSAGADACGWSVPESELDLTSGHLHVRLLADSPHVPGAALDVRAGEIFSVALDVSPEDEGTLVILRDRVDGWGLLLPLCEDDELSPAELRREDRGPCVVTLVAGPRVRTEGWAVVIYPEGIDWSADEDERWRGLQGRLAEGQVPWSSFRVAVRPH